jgi:flavin reductase (DIM6/NTAB) family NADH-FMN oxidoreductase RutF
MTNATLPAPLTIVPSELTPRDRYQLLTQCLVPRPIAVVATRNTNDTINLAPYSFFAGVAVNPPTLAFSASSKRDGSMKDTPQNVFRTKSFVVHLMSEHYLEQIAQCGEDLPYGESELAMVGFTTSECTHISSQVRVNEADIAFECTLLDSLIIQSNDPPFKDLPPSTLLLGKIEAIHLKEGLMKESQIDYELFRPLARLGRSLYSGLGTVFDKPTKGR